MKLHSIYVGRPREVLYQGKVVLTGIYKEQIKGPVKVATLNIDGDQQADLKVHGGIEKAVYAYPQEHYTYWKSVRPDLHFEPGIFGENLSITGLNEKEVFIGDQYQIGSVRFCVTIPRLPCFKLGIKMKDPAFIKEFMNARLTGFYFKVLAEGMLNDGDSIKKMSEDGHKLTVEEVVKLYSSERENAFLLKKALRSPHLPLDWKEYVQRLLNRLGEGPK